MYREEIKRFEQDGFELVAFTSPDDYMNSIPYEDFDEPPGPEDTKEFTDLYYNRKNQLEQGLWHFVGVIVEASLTLQYSGKIDRKIVLGDASLWGIESDAGEYFEEVIQELAPEALDEAKANLQKISEVAPNFCS